MITRSPRSRGEPKTGPRCRDLLGRRPAPQPVAYRVELGRIVGFALVYTAPHLLLQRHERPNREIRRRTRVVGTFPDGRSAPVLVIARFKYIAKSEFGSRRYLGVTLLDE